jgi:competence ComEA-like helix-hairpin-helix protein
MGGVFTRDERAVILFVAAAVTVGSLVLAIGKVDPAADDAIVPGDGDPAFPGTAAQVARAPVLVDVNRAGQDEFTLLPGIGPVKAREIVAHRDVHGPFRSIDGLDEVKGIGPSTLERLRPFVTLGGARAKGDSTAGEPEAPLAHDGSRDATPPGDG